MKIITIDKFNEISNSRYKSTKELIFNPLKFEDEIVVRNKILNNPFDLSALIVVDKIIDEKYEIFINSIIYEDIKEEII